MTVANRRRAQKRQTAHSGRLRRFATGAIRDGEDDKLDYDGTLSPLVLHCYASYIHSHRRLKNGTTRAADNWQYGFPLETYMRSGWRHFMEWWGLHRGYKAKFGQTCGQASAASRRSDLTAIERALCGVLFNASGYLHEVRKAAHQLRRTR